MTKRWVGARPAISFLPAVLMLLVQAVMVLPLPAVAAGPAHSYDITLSAGPYRVVTEAGGLQTLSMDSFVPMASPGDPVLPHRAYNILLPPAVQAGSVSLSVIKADREPLAGSRRIAPARPLATEDGGRRVEDYGAGKDIKNGYNMNIYGSNTAYPAEIVSLLPGGQMRKWKFVTLDFTPFQLNPSSGSLQYIKSVTVRLSYTIDPLRTSYADLADSTLDDAAAQTFYNFSQFATEYLSAGGPAAGVAQYDYVIITTGAIQSGSAKLAGFVTHKQSRGYSVLVVNETVWGAATGQAPNTKADKIRKWLQDNYVGYGIQYVLLIGNPTPYESTEGDVPMKMCWPRRNESYPEAPTDLYFSDLTGNWDLNANGYFGEWADCGSGGLDVNPEVFVGRIPVYAADYASLDSILQKTMDYENQGDIAWRKSALLPMGFSDSSTDGAYLAEQMKNDYLTAGGYSTWRMYQDGGGACAVNSVFPSEQELRGGTGVRDRWAAGDYGIMAWWAHGSSTSASVGYSGCSDGTLFQSSYTAPLEDGHPSFTYQGSCTNGYPESSINLQYSLLKKGGIGTLSATRVSWYYVGQTNFSNSASNAGIGYQYVKRLVQNETAGRALGLTRQALSSYMYSNHLLMNFQDFNLYGDPSLSLDSHSAGSGTVPGGHFTIVALPDTQFYSALYPATFTAQTQWVVDNRIPDNIVFVTHEGDIVDNNANWDNADTAMSILDGQVPYGMAPGNNDGAPGTTANFNAHFPYTRYSGQSWYGGHYGADNDNSYQLFSAGGQDFLILHIEYGADSGVLAWADGVLKANPARRALLTTHYLLNADGSFGAPGQAVYGALKGNPNLFLMLCGHTGVEARRSDTYDGHTIHTLLADYQSRSNGGDGWLRTLEFAPADNTVTVRTYSPTLNRFETDGDSQFMLDLATFAPTVTNASGATGVTATSAILNGNLTSDGGADTTVIIYGGTSDGGTTPVNWNFGENLGLQPVGPFFLGVALTPGTTYYYRCYAENSAGGSSWADETASFHTQAPSGLWRSYWAGPGKDWWRFSSGIAR